MVTKPRWSRPKGDASRFQQLQNAYAKSPDVTRDRLYLETMQEVLSRSSKVFIDSNGSNSMLYLPLDKILEQRRSETAQSGDAARNGSGSAPAGPAILPNRPAVSETGTRCAPVAPSIADRAGVQSS
ncbi:MAG: hypothetical protein R3E68_19360 [Burkholderiaceae bacterium]